MLIAIPTYGRAYSQRTWYNLPPELREQTILFVQAREFAKHAVALPEARLYQLPDDIRDIASTRQYIASLLNYDKVVMIDDDLDFAVRREDNPAKFYPASGQALVRLFSDIERLLSLYAHVGVRCREGANRGIDAYLFNNRILRIHGFDLTTFRREQIYFEPMRFMTDFDVTLQLLEKGYCNCIINWMVQNQPGSNTPGGCSEARSMWDLANSAQWLAARHPKFVSLVTKQTKSSWGGGARTDVRIQWKAAYYSGGQAGTPAVLDGGEGGNQAPEADVSEAVD